MHHLHISRYLSLVLLLCLSFAASGVAQVCPQPTAAETLASTIEVVGTLEANSGIVNSLMNPLTSALTSIATSDVDAAVRSLEAFQRRLATQSGKAVTVADADLLTAVAQELIAEITAPPAEPCPCLAIPEFADFTAPLPSGAICLLDSSFVGDVSLIVPEGDTGRSVDTSPRSTAPTCGYVDGNQGVSLELTITESELLGCQQLLQGAAANAGITCISSAP